jgi:hypothetical protein
VGTDGVRLAHELAQARDHLSAGIAALDRAQLTEGDVDVT